MKTAVNTALSSLILLAASLVSSVPAGAAGVAPAAADHHQHLFSPEIGALLAPADAAPVPGAASGSNLELPAEKLIALLDSAGIKRALVLSTAYMFGAPNRQVDNEYAKVRAENDWTGAQAARYPERLRAFCGVNPLKDYALAEISRCAADPQLKHGLKLHFGNSRVQLEKPEHLARLIEVFALANRHNMALAVHTRASISQQHPYGAAQARLFIDKLLPAAPKVPVQVAHMGGSGPGFEDAPAHAFIRVLTQARAAGDRRTRNLWFDVASTAHPSNSPGTSRLLALLVREAGIDRVLYGSDSALGENLRPREAWAAFTALPLEQDEIRRIGRNVAPYLR